MTFEREPPDFTTDLPLDVMCECGHVRGDHNGHTATQAPDGAHASFGGSACEMCWLCPTFRPANSPGEPR